MQDYFRQEIINKINKFIQPYSKKIGNGRLEISKGFFMPITEYVHLGNMVIQKLANSFDDQDIEMRKIIKSKMIYLEDVFEMHKMVRSACTGRVDLLMYIDIEQPYIEINADMYTGNKGFSEIKIKSTNPNEPEHFIKMEEFVRTFYTRINGGECTYGNFTFNSLAIENFATIISKDEKVERSGHSNMLLVMKNNDINEINLILYEPHGYSKEDDSTYMTYVRQYHLYFLNILKPMLKTVSGCEVNILDPIQISCPKGIQNSIGDTFGYCKLISTLWLYIVLGLFKSDLDTQLKNYLSNNLDIVESYLISLRNLNDIVINFSAEIINNYYLKHFTTKDLKLLFKSLLQISYNERRQEGDEIDLGIIKPKSKSKPKPKSKFKPKSNQTFIPTKDRKDDCSECKHENECISGNCVKGICSPTHFYAKGREYSKILFLTKEERLKKLSDKNRENLPITIGNKCKEHDQCCSGKCINYKCSI